MKLFPIYLLRIVSLSLFLGIACLYCASTTSPRVTKPTVSLTWHEKAKSLVILGKDLGLLVRILPRSHYPYSHNANTAVWVGTDFPHKKAIQMILWSRKYYQQLRYFALSDFVSSYTDRYDNDLFIGGPTQKALKLDLRPWRKKDFRRLKRIKSQKQFHAFIRARYPGKKSKKTSQRDRQACCRLSYFASP